ncbi:MAG: lytic transglycosylase domain-containing protein [Deltaproteobacteria bacterium]|nr:lytic transglycosylase domain-containing protein [Deltaproteobacteria bacterium]
MQKPLISFFVVIAIIFLIAPHYDNRLRGESSLYHKSYSETVEQAIVKSVLWASDEQIRRLITMVEKKYGSDIMQISKKYYACPKDIKAIAIVESLMDEEAESSEGAIGLMGVKRTTGEEMGFHDIEHPINNLKAGTKYFKVMLNKFKDRDLALAAYNLGPGEVENRLINGFNPETIDYIWKIRRVKQLVI